MSIKTLVITLMVFGVSAYAQPLDATSLRSELDSVNEQLVFLQSARTMPSNEWQRELVGRYPVIMERVQQSARAKWEGLPPEVRAKKLPEVSAMELASVIYNFVGLRTNQLQERQRQLTQMLIGAASGASQNSDSARMQELERRVKALEVANQLILARLDQLLKGGQRSN